MFTRVDIKEVLERLKEFKPPYSLTAYLGGVEVFSVDKLTARDIRERLEKFSDKSSYIIVRFDALTGQKIFAHALGSFCPKIWQKFSLPKQNRLLV